MFNLHACSAIDSNDIMHTNIDATTCIGYESLIFHGQHLFHRATENKHYKVCTCVHTKFAK